jgi:hypothetical protein
MISISLFITLSNVAYISGILLNGIQLICEVLVLVSTTPLAPPPTCPFSTGSDLPAFIINWHCSGVNNGLVVSTIKDFHFGSVMDHCAPLFILDYKEHHNLLQVFFLSHLLN